MDWEWHPYSDIPECWHADYLAALRAAGYVLPELTPEREGKRRLSVFTTTRYTLLNVDCPSFGPEDYPWLAAPK